MLDAFAILLCSKLCWHNWLKPIYTIAEFLQIKMCCSEADQRIILEPMSVISSLPTLMIKIEILDFYQDSCDVATSSLS